MPAKSNVAINPMLPANPSMPSIKLNALVAPTKTAIVIMYWIPNGIS